VIASHGVEYLVYILPRGGAEQKVDEWWEAISN
jgi:hypothetical protein